MKMRTSVVLMLLNIQLTRWMPMEGDYFSQWQVRPTMLQQVKMHLHQVIFLS